MREPVVGETLHDEMITVVSNLWKHWFNQSPTVGRNRGYASERFSQAKSRLLHPLQSQVFAPPPDAHHYHENCFVLPWIVHTFHTTAAARRITA
jgi:hypothetical protein